MSELAAEYPRYGLRRIVIILGRHGHPVSFGRPIGCGRWRGLQVPPKRPARASRYLIKKVAPESNIAEPVWTRNWPS